MLSAVSTSSTDVTPSPGGVAGAASTCVTGSSVAPGAAGAAEGSTAPIPSGTDCSRVIVTIVTPAASAAPARVARCP